MPWVEILTFIAGVMTSTAPGLQAIKTIRSGNVEGLSVGTYCLLCGLGCFAVLIGIQYGILMMIVLNGLGTVFNIIILFLISRRALVILAGSIAAAAGVGVLVAPSFMHDLFTTRWAEQIGFIYGIYASATFLPQVLLTRKTRDVAAISLPNYALMSAGLVIWVIVCALIGNWSLIFWNSMIMLMVMEMFRLKFVEERKTRPISAIAGYASPDLRS